jgi:PIN like domain
MAAQNRKSRKRSSGKSGGRPRKFTCYLDASSGAFEVTKAFSREKIKYKLHTNFFSAHTHDSTWLPFVGTKGWVLITTDDSMAYSVVEKHAIMEFKVRSFVYKSHMTGDEIARFLVKMMPAMRRFNGSHERPFIGYLMPNGRIKLIMDKNGVIYDR